MTFPLSVSFKNRLKAVVTADNQQQILQYIVKTILDEKAKNVVIKDMHVTYRGSTSYWNWSLFRGVDDGIFSLIYKDNSWLLNYQINMLKLFIGTAIMPVLGILLIGSNSFAQIKVSDPIKVNDLATKYVKVQFHSVFQDKIPADVRMIALGEVSHGGYEPLAFKANMVKYLIEEQGCRAILFEASDFSMIRPIRNYLDDKNKTDTSFVTKWVKKYDLPKSYSAVYSDLFKWIKQYNLSHPKDKVQAVGFEIGRDQGVIDMILTKYIIPFNYTNSLDFVYKFNSDLDNEEKIALITKWFSPNEQSLKTKLTPSDYHWLKFYIKNGRNGINYLKERKSQIGLANLHRDSMFAENVKSLLGKTKSIVWAHNLHVIRATFKQMGNLLDEFLGNKYYVIATDFSKAAAVEITDNDLWSDEKMKYSTKVFNADNATAAVQLSDRYKLSEGIFFRQDLIDMKVGQNTNLIDVNGIQVLYSAAHNSFDALVVFKYIFPTGAEKQRY